MRSCPWETGQICFNIVLPDHLHNNFGIEFFNLPLDEDDFDNPEWYAKRWIEKKCKEFNKFSFHFCQGYTANDWLYCELWYEQSIEFQEWLLNVAIELETIEFTGIGKIPCVEVR